MRQPFRLPVTGSRTWNDSAIIEHALPAILTPPPEGVLLVHGGLPAWSRRHRCRHSAQTPGCRIEAHPAD